MLPFKDKTKAHKLKKFKKQYPPEEIRILNYEDSTAEILIVDDDSQSINNVLQLLQELDLKASVAIKSMSAL